MKDKHMKDKHMKDKHMKDKHMNPAVIYNSRVLALY